MLNIAICDDEALSAKQISKNVRNEFLRHNVEVDIKTFTNGKKLLSEFEKKPFDIVFLDILMPGTSGFEVAKEIRKTGVETYLVFVTAKDDLVFDSFDYYPFQFIRKEELFEPDLSKNEHLTQSIKKTVERLIEYIGNQNQILLYDSNKKKHLIFPFEIEYIESDKHYLNYHIVDVNEPLRERGNIGEKCDELSGVGIIRIQKKYAVNSRHIKFIDNEYDQIIMKTGKKLPISKFYKNDMRESLKSFLRDST